jgi:hypothetical protein
MAVSQVSQAAAFLLPQRMIGRGPVFQTADMQQPALQVDLIPAKVYQLRNTKSVTIGDQD